MIKIRHEIDEIAEGKQPRGNNTITNAPHTQQVVISSEWDRCISLLSLSRRRRRSVAEPFLRTCSPYTREQAAYPLPHLRHRKFWPSVSRVDDKHGDMNLVCECGTVDEYASEPA